MSPIWHERICEFEGIVNHKERKVEFKNDNFADDFYDLYGYNPDEQSNKIKETLIPRVSKAMTWTEFYKRHKNNGLYIPDSDFLEALDAF